MKSPKSKATEAETIHVPLLQRNAITVRIIGTTPLFMNRMSAKAKQTLLVGGKKKTAADRVAIKHDPLSEYRASAEMMPPCETNSPTALGMRVTAIKGAMCAAAIETAGITRAAAQRLLFMPGDLVPLYGTPQLRMDVTRSADINRTPDIRSRAYFPKWGAEVEIYFIAPQLTALAVLTLLQNAGMLIGVGDYRQEKGKGAFGSFRVIGPADDDDEWNELIANHARPAQELALADPEPANPETEELLEFFGAELKRRSGNVKSIAA